MRPYAVRQQDWRHKVKQRTLAALRQGRTPQRPGKSDVHSKGAWARGEGGSNNSGGRKR